MLSSSGISDLSFHRMHIDCDFVLKVTDRMVKICDFSPDSIPLPMIGFERPPVRRISEDGFEALGIYNSETHAIRLYLNSIEQCALDLKIDAQTICEIVLVHEIAHLVTHKGTSCDKCAKEWRDFETASIENAEWAAQSLTFHVLIDTPEMISAFKAMAVKSPECYQNWEKNIELFKISMYSRSGRAVGKDCLIDHDE